MNLFSRNGTSCQWRRFFGKPNNPTKLKAPWCYRDRPCLPQGQGTVVGILRGKTPCFDQTTKRTVTNWDRLCAKRRNNLILLHLAIIDRFNCVALNTNATQPLKSTGFRLYNLGWGWTPKNKHRFWRIGAPLEEEIRAFNGSVHTILGSETFSCGVCIYIYIHIYIYLTPYLQFEKDLEWTVVSFKNWKRTRLLQYKVVQDLW